MNIPQHQLTIDPLPQSAMPQWPTAVVLRLLGIVGTEQNSIEFDDCLPSFRATLSVAEAIHRALIRKAGNGRRIDCPELTGQNLQGHPLTGPHQHAHVLPVDVDDDGRIDHVVIYAPMGLGPIAQQAISKLKTLFSSGGKPWLHLQAVDSPLLDRWLCAATHQAPWLATNSRESTSVSDHPRECNGARDWISATPFVPSRYLKNSGKNSLVGQVNAELASRHFPPADVVVQESIAANSFDFQRHPDHAQPPQRIAYLLRLTFAEPVFGPICLGYASHFGLGLFRTHGQ